MRRRRAVWLWNGLGLLAVACGGPQPAVTEDPRIIIGDAATSPVETLRSLRAFTCTQSEAACAESRATEARLSLELESIAALVCSEMDERIEAGAWPEAKQLRLELEAMVDVVDAACLPAADARLAEVDREDRSRFLGAQALALRALAEARLPEAVAALDEAERLALRLGAEVDPTLRLRVRIARAREAAVAPPVEVLARVDARPAPRTAVPRRTRPPRVPNERPPSLRPAAPEPSGSAPPAVVAAPDPSRVDAALQAAEAAYAREDLEEARRQWLRVLELAPGHGRATEGLRLYARFVSLGASAPDRTPQ